MRKEMEYGVRQIRDDLIPNTGKICDSHKFVFTLVTASIAAILNTSLLTEKVFHCQNFANKCNVVYLSCGLTSFVVAFFFLSLNFTTLLISGWLLVPCKIAIVLISVFGNGVIARNLFILCYGINGALEALILQSCTYVISRHFTNSTFAVFYSGYPGGLILIGVAQYLLECTIGTETIEDMRLCLVICHLIQAVTATVSLGWITYLYVTYNREIPIEKNDSDYELCSYTTSDSVASLDKARKFVKVLGTIRYFFPRLILQLEAMIIRYFFYPCLIPFILEIPDHAKLIIALTYNIADFAGMIVLSGINERIDPLARRLSQSRLLFIFLRDIHLHLVGLLTLVASSLVVWNSWIGSEFIVTSPPTIFFITVFVCFAAGGLLARAMNGCFPLVQYYYTQTRADGTRPIDEEVLQMGNLVNDLVVFFAYAFCSMSSSLSNIVEHMILSHRDKLT